MARARINLNEGEQFRWELHHHWKVMIMPTIWAVLLIGLLVTAIVFLPHVQTTYILVGLPCIGLVVWLALWPFISWRSARFVFTDNRILVREGVVQLEKQDIFLVQVNDVKMKQGFLDRIFRSGTLTVQFSDKKDPSVLKNIPNIQEVYERVVRDLVERKEARVDRLRDTVSGLLGQQGGAKAPAPKAGDNLSSGTDKTMPGPA